MHRTSFQRLIAILCFVAFVLGQTVFAAFGIRCTDESGASRIEIACVRSAQGECLMRCVAPEVHVGSDNHDSDPVPPVPCKDEPVGSHASAAKVLPSNVVLEAVFAVVVAAILWDHWSLTCDESVRVYTSCQDRDRPPDSLTRLRTVILIV